MGSGGSVHCGAGFERQGGEGRGCCLLAGLDTVKDVELHIGLAFKLPRTDLQGLNLILECTNDYLHFKITIHQNRL